MCVRQVLGNNLNNQNTEVFTSRSAQFGAERKRKRRVRSIILSVVAVVLIAGVAAGAYVWSLSSNFSRKSNTVALDFSKEQQENRPVKDPDDGSMNILMLGVDHSDEADNGADSLKGPAGQRSDSMMLVHIPEDRSQIYVMSVVRDLWVEIPGHGMNKLNSAISFGGVPLLMQTLEGMFDTKIDHVAMIDFEGFRELSTALGGIKVDNEIAFTANDTDYFYPEGEITLEGDRALRFVRERKSFIDGDYQRVKNQRKFIASAASQLLSRETLTNPVKLYEIVDKVAPYLTLDEDFDAATLVGLGQQLSAVDPEHMAMFTIPTAGSSTSPDGQSIELASELAVAQISEALQTDTMDEYLKAHPPAE
ncbi:LCP family protein [Glutamicibacter endophyticus]